MNSEVKKIPLQMTLLDHNAKTSFGENSVNINVAPLNFIG